MTDLNTSENISFNIYPNPTSNTIFVKTEVEEIHILMYDAQGKLMINTRNKEIDINYLSKGIYLLNIIQNGEIIASEKVLKM